MRGYPDVRTVLALGSLLLVGCGVTGDPDLPRVLGTAYVGPATIPIRKDLTPRSDVATSLKHGDRVDIVERRRRFAKVRTISGQMGWLDGRQLMSERQMAELRGLSDANRRAPSMGEAMVYDVLNIHTEPNRNAPSFAQLPERGLADVLVYLVAARVPYQGAPLPTERKRLPPARKKKKESDTVPPPPRPAAPALPDNWLDLSVSPKDNDPVDDAKPAAPPVRVDDWALIRTKDGKVGWALASMLVLNIPDEVAQYAEGARIIAYFNLGTVDDDGQAKSHWLWVTNTGKRTPYQFDGMRVFIWALRKHRYETAYRERDLRGYLPVEVLPGTPPRFSVVVENKEGQRVKRTYEFLVYRVNRLSEEPYVTPPAVPAGMPPDGRPDSAAPSDVPWYQRLFGT